MGHCLRLCFGDAGFRVEGAGSRISGFIRIRKVVSLNHRSLLGFLSPGSDCWGEVRTILSGGAPPGFKLRVLGVGVQVSYWIDRGQSVEPFSSST